MVTVVGAGISGLTAAHELVERGFPVQVVEAAEDEFVEYGCAIGGLAANQFARARMPVADLHKDLLEKLYEDNDEVNVVNIEKFRDVDLERTAMRFPLKQVIRFDKHVHGPVGRVPIPDYDQVVRTWYEPTTGWPYYIPIPIPDDWLCYWDRHGVSNKAKLDQVLETIRQAVSFYTELYLPNLWLRQTYGPPLTDADWVCSKPALTPLQWKDGGADQVALAKLFAARETFVVQIVGYTDTDGDPEENRRIAAAWADEVRDYLLKHDPWPDSKAKVPFEYRLDVVVVGSANPVFDQSTALGRNLSNRVEFSIYEQVLPGEHGFRFFPAFYRNLFDTMRRTPLFNVQGAILKSAFDQLVLTPHPAIATGLGGQPKNVETNIASFWQIDQMLKLLGNDLGLTLADLFGLEYYMLRFLSSCGARREEEAEPINLLTYIGGADPSLRFSAAALAFLKNAPRALAAMSAEESDARTQLDITAQLMAVNPLGPPPENMTLNGPTSKAWFDHWKAYLANQGVKFFVGEIGNLAEVNGRFVPVYGSGSDSRSAARPVPEDPTSWFQAPRPDGSDIDRFRFVLALSYQAATALLSRKASDVEPTDSPFSQLIAFDVNCGRHGPHGGDLIPVHRTPETGKEPCAYPLRTISGAQMFFPEDYRFGQGNVYFARTPWDLTSISQLSYWQDGLDPLGEFRGQISVDIGAWHNFANRLDAKKPVLGDHGDVAWYCSADEIAANVWAQVKSGFGANYQVVIAPPRYFHLDRNLVFSEEELVRVPGELPRTEVLRIVNKIDSDEAELQRQLKLTVVPVPDSGVSSPGPADLVRHAGSLTVTVAGAISKLWPAVYAQGLNPEDDKNIPQDILVAPRALGSSFIVAFRASGKPFFLSWSAPAASPEVKSFHVEKAEDRLQALKDHLPTTFGVSPLDEQSSAFQLKAPEDGVLWVANADRGIEIADGPMLELQTIGDAFSVVSPPLGGKFDVVARGAVRANGLIVVPAARAGVLRPFDEINSFELGIGVGVGEKIVRAPAAFGDTAETPCDVRDNFYNWLTSSRSATDRAIALKVCNSAGPGIVISPVSKQHSGLIRILPEWKPGEGPGFTKDVTDPVLHKFKVKVGDQLLDLDCAGLSVTEIRDFIIDQLEKREPSNLRVEAIGGDSLLVKRAPDSKAAQRPIELAVLNADARIEIIGAPALVVETRHVFLNAPPSGFVVLRNEAEFLINIPDQWRLRPGLRRDRADIPRRYRELAGDFGDKHTEIYYGDLGGPRLFEYWTAAGTYMATYTRITTMEAANESGRHAAAAILYQVLASGQKDPTGKRIGLAGNFPMIWRVEDYEPDDLRFARELDESLLAAGLPHALDILGVTDLVNSILAASVSDHPALAEAMKIIRAAVFRPEPTTLANLQSALNGLKGLFGRIV